MKKLTLIFGLLTLNSSTYCLAGDRLADIVLLKQDSDLQAVLKDWQPTLDLFEKATGKKAKILVNKQAAPLRAAVQNGEADIVIDSVYNLSALDGKGNLEPALTVWKKGKEEYNGCLYTKLDSPVKSAADLVGKKIVGEDPYSTSSFALPFGLVLEAVKFEDLKSLDLAAKVKATGKPALAIFKETAPDAKKVNFAFSGGDENTALWVATGAADAGASACSAIDEKKFKIIAKSPMVPRMVVAFHKKFNPELRAKIEQALIALPESDTVLVKIGKVKKIEPTKETHQTEIKKVLNNFNKLVKISDAE